MNSSLPPLSRSPIMTKSVKRSRNLLMRKKAVEPRARLFCFHYAGGGGSAFLQWANALPSSIEIVAIQLPGRENRILEPVAEDMPKLLAELLEDLSPLLDLPYGVFGHSFGALLGMECCVLLHQRGARLPRHIIVSGANPPGRPLSFNETDLDALALERMSQRLGPAFFSSLDPETTNMMLATLRGDLRLMFSYEFSTKLPPVPITVLGAPDDPLVSIDALYEWGEMALSHEVVLLEGGHFFFEQHTARILDIVQRCLQDRRTPTRPPRIEPDRRGEEQSGSALPAHCPV